MYGKTDKEGRLLTQANLRLNHGIHVDIISMIDIYLIKDRRKTIKDNIRAIIKAIMTLWWINKQRRKYIKRTAWLIFVLYVWSLLYMGCSSSDYQSGLLCMWIMPNNWFFQFLGRQSNLSLNILISSLKTIKNCKWSYLSNG